MKVTKKFKENTLFWVFFYVFELYLEMFVNSQLNPLFWFGPPLCETLWTRGEKRTWYPRIQKKKLDESTHVDWTVWDRFECKTIEPFLCVCYESLPLNWQLLMINLWNLYSYLRFELRINTLLQLMLSECFVMGLFVKTQASEKRGNCIKVQT